jgi:hypothetical protein
MVRSGSELDRRKRKLVQHGNRYCTRKRTKLRLARLSASPLGCSCRGARACCGIAICLGIPLPKIATCAPFLDDMASLNAHTIPDNELLYPVGRNDINAMAEVIHD